MFPPEVEEVFTSWMIHPADLVVLNDVELSGELLDPRVHQSISYTSNTKSIISSGNSSLSQNVVSDHWIIYHSSIINKILKNSENYA